MFANSSLHSYGEGTYAITPKLDVTVAADTLNFRQDFNLYFTGLAGALDFTNPCHRQQG